MQDIQSYEFFKKLQALPFVEEVLLYGSRARGTNRPRSDIDLAVACPTATDSDWLRVLEIIDNADTLLKIDCVRFDQLSDANLLKQEIMKDAIALYQRESK
ncbi:MAG: nucleotidyltransferase domain-containing protein [Gammaproteobacteria bacterium]